MEQKRKKTKVCLANVFYNKLVGLGLVLISAIEMIFLHEATASVIFLPVGIWLFFTKEKCIG